MIIGLGYRARSGKDTVAQILARRTDTFEPMAFANILKEAAGVIFGLTQDQLYGDKKESLDRFWELTPRNILQRLGTESIRNVFGPDTWVKALERYIDQHGGKDQDIVITDVRFPNEAEAIKSWGGKVVLVERPGAGAVGGVALHPSETALDGYRDWDHVVVNDGSLEDLENRALAMLAHVGWY